MALKPGLLEQANGGIVIYFDEVADMPLGHAVQDPARSGRSAASNASAARRKGQVDLRVDIQHQQAIWLKRSPPAVFREELLPPPECCANRRPQSWRSAARIFRSLASMHFIDACFNECPGPAATQTVRRRPWPCCRRCSWPGNVRQLKNVIERVLILGDESGQ